jgi:hypothetical protein
MTEVCGNYLIEKATTKLVGTCLIQVRVDGILRQLLDREGDDETGCYLLDSGER